MFKNRKTSGFTLIELIVVMVILGILAAFIIPRFAKLDTEARVAVVNGVGGSVSSAAALAHSLSLAKGKGANESVVMDGQTVTMHNYYPSGDETGIIAAIGGQHKGFSKTVNSGAVSLTKDGAKQPTNCSISYTQAATATSAPTIVIDDSNC